MLSKCEHCGEVAVDDTEPQEVCGACGIVVEGINWGSANTTSVTQRYFTPSKRFGLKAKRDVTSRGTFKYGLSILDNLCHVYSLDAMVKAEIADLFKQVSSSRYYKSSDDAAIMVACCLFLTQRKNKQSIPLNSICSELQCSKGRFSRHLKFLKSYLSSNESFEHSLNGSLESNQQVTDNDAEEDLSESIASWIQMVCDRAEDEEKSKLIKKTTELVKLAKSCWLLTGRSPKSVVVSSAFLCWKSMHPSRKKVSFRTFCSIFDVRECMASKRIPELKALLLKLGRQIPSYSENYVNERNLLFHLDTILENSETLRNDLFPEPKTREAVDTVEYSTFRVPTKRKPRKEPKTAVKYDPNMNASDIEISDSEIDSYLFSNKTKVVNLFDSKSLKT